MPIEVSKGLPIAETFHSLQGEGTYVGTPMHFIRLAGCPVGKKATVEYEFGGQPPPTPAHAAALPIYPSYCKTWDGRFFPCDTDFSCHTYKTVDELIGETWEKHICLTGGEPLIHQQNLISSGFFQQAFQKKIQIHIETSGTILLDPKLYNDSRLWLTVAPKWECKPQMLEYADEIKLLIDEGWDELKWEQLSGPVVTHTENIFVSPINGEKEINQENVGLALVVLRSHPTWRLSCQLHKLLGLQ